MSGSRPEQGEFPGSPVLTVQGTQVQFLIGEPRSQRRHLNRSAAATEPDRHSQRVHAPEQTIPHDAAKILPAVIKTQSLCVACSVVSVMPDSLRPHGL